MVSDFSVIVNDNIDSLVGEVKWVVDVEDELFVPVRIEVFGLGLSLLPLPLEVDLNEGTHKPIAVFGHQAVCIVNFHHEFNTGHG
ncbi:hypothetical protein ACFX1Q_028174 [Malus domestica]